MQPRGKRPLVSAGLRIWLILTLVFALCACSDILKNEPYLAKWRPWLEGETTASAKPDSAVRPQRAASDTAHQEEPSALEAESSEHEEPAAAALRASREAQTAAQTAKRASEEAAEASREAMEAASRANGGSPAATLPTSSVNPAPPAQQSTAPPIVLSSADQATDQKNRASTVNAIQKLNQAMKKINRATLDADGVQRTALADKLLEGARRALARKDEAAASSLVTKASVMLAPLIGSVTDASGSPSP